MRGACTVFLLSRQAFFAASHDRDGLGARDAAIVVAGRQGILFSAGLEVHRHVSFFLLEPSRVAKGDLQHEAVTADEHHQRAEKRRKRYDSDVDGCDDGALRVGEDRLVFAFPVNKRKRGADQSVHPDKGDQQASALSGHALTVHQGLLYAEEPIYADHSQVQNRRAAAEEIDPYPEPTAVTAERLGPDFAIDGLSQAERERQNADQ